MAIGKKDKEGFRELSVEGMDERALFELYRENGTREVRNIIFDRYTYLAEILAKKYISRGVDYQDLFQIASIGLINAIERFDIDKGYKFSSFATPTIIGEIKRYFRDKGWMIRVPRRLQKLSRRVSMAVQQLAQEFNRSPRVPEIAEYLNVSEEEILEAMEAGGGYSPQSLDETYSSGENKELSLRDLIGTEDAALRKVEDKDFIERCIGKLDEKELKVLKERYFRGRTQSQIAKDMKVSQMTISRIERRIFQKFRKQLEA